MSEPAELLAAEVLPGVVARSTLWSCRTAIGKAVSISVPIRSVRSIRSAGGVGDVKI